MLWLVKRENICGCRADGEARGVLRLLCRAEVRVARRRLGDSGLYQVRRGFSQPDRGIRRGFAEIEISSSSSWRAAQDQSSPLRAEIARATVTASITVSVRRVEPQLFSSQVAEAQNRRVELLVAEDRRRRRVPQRISDDRSPRQLLRSRMA